VEPRRSLSIPFRFAGRDLAAAVGHDLRVAQVRNVCLTNPGELPWRTRFGAGLDRLRHRRPDDVLVELVRVLLRESLRKWSPSVELTDVSVRGDGEILDIGLTLRSRDSGASTNLEVRL